jgi:EmrB/QacA subfamily drug resistance transporter
MDGRPATARDTRLVVLGVMGAVFLAAMESTCVATAMPTVVASLGGLHGYSWVFSGFLLASTVAMPIWGRLADQVGRRRTYLAGLGLFLAGSALSGLAQSMTQLIAFRALQGLGAGSLYPVGMTIIADQYGLAGRARMQGYFSAVWGVASLLGPLLGGLITDTLSWRWVFYVNVPLGGLAALSLVRGLGADAPGPSRVHIDYAGMAVFSVAATTGLVALVEGGRGAAWHRPGVLSLLAVSAILGVVFVLVERRAAEPLIPLGLFARPMVRAAAVTGLFSSMAMFGALAYVPLFLQVVVGISATRAGFVLTPFVLGWVTCSIVGARVAPRLGYRRVVLTGMAALAAAFALFTGWSESISPWTAARDVTLAGIGMGLVFVPMLIAAQSAVGRLELGAATALTSFSRSLGGAVGVAALGSVMAHRLHGEIGALVAQVPVGLREGLVALSARPDLLVNPLVRGTIAGEPVALLRTALAHALDAVFMAGLVLALLALASAFLVPGGVARDLAEAREPAPRPR